MWGACSVTVNQLMDFNKLENDTLKLRVKRTDIISQLQRFVDIFRINANEKGIALNTYGMEDTFLMWLDVDKLDKIVGNLLSNALKFTPNGGKVELCFDVITREEAARLFTLTDKDIDTQYVKVAVVGLAGTESPRNSWRRYSNATTNWTINPKAPITGEPASACTMPAAWRCCITAI